MTTVFGQIVSTIAESSLGQCCNRVVIFKKMGGGMQMKEQNKPPEFPPVLLQCNFSCFLKPLCVSQKKVYHFEYHHLDLLQC